MKTPDEIKKGLERCQLDKELLFVDCSHCPYYMDTAHCDFVLHADALAYIQQLETRLAQVERERDACIKDIQQCQGAICNSCKHHYRPNPEIRRYACAILGEFDTFLEDGEGKPFVCGRFEWRGICEENAKEDADA